MAEIPAQRKLIDQQEVKYRSSVAESTWTKIGGSINFLFRRAHQEKQFFLNGPYSILSTPKFKLDGLTVFNFDATIFNVYMFNLVAGSSGTTKLDIRLKPKLSGAFNSIFTTPPEISAAAGDDKWVGIGDSISGCVAPVLTSGPNPLNVNAGDGLVLDLLTAQTNGQNCGILVHYRPR